MEINFKSKFNLEDVVWFICDNQVVQGIIHTINYQRIESVDISRKHKSIFAKLKSCLDRMESKTQIRYQVHRIRENGEFHSGTYFLSEDKVFATKEQLLKNL